MHAQPHHHPSHTFAKTVWRQYRRHALGMIGLAVVILYILVGIYAPFLASSKPIVVHYDGHWYFPLFRYLFYRGFYTTALDQFFNLLIFICPLAILTFVLPRKIRLPSWLALVCTLLTLFVWLQLRLPDDPAADPQLTAQRLSAKQPLTWKQQLQYMTPYAQLNLVLEARHQREQHERLARQTGQHDLQTLWHREQFYEATKIKQLSGARAQELRDRRLWLQDQQNKITFLVMPFIRPFHWEEDAGGDERINQLVPWWELTRSGHKDLTAALIFGVRVSLVVGFLAIGIALLIGIPVGAMAGYYGGWIDIFVCRLMEIWEAMPTFFMLLFVVAVLQSKSILIVILVIGIFGWTGFSRYLRGEFFKQRNLPYVEACHAMGFHDTYIMFRHILPNAIPPLLTLLPFAVMGAISTEAGLSFLGLGDTSSSSWGVLMDEGRQSFPAQSYLLWPPAILLTVLLVAIALIGDALRDAIDPRMRRQEA